MSDLIVSGDCGGTNTRLSLWLIPHGATHTIGDIPPGENLFSKKYVNEEFDSFVSVCVLFLQDANIADRSPVACVLACAGPILNNTVDFTNIEHGWKIDGEQLAKQLGIKTVKLINDFTGTGYGLLTLQPHEYIVLNDVAKEEGQTIASVGAGTGLGECYLTAGMDGKYSCFASEGGHCDWAPSDEIEIELYNDIKAKLGCERRFSTERIVSGPGLANTYEFLARKFPNQVNTEVHAAFEAANTLSAKVVGENAPTDALCHQALELFVAAYGREVGNAMLKFLPRGGFYITGGLAPKNRDYFTRNSLFLDAVFDKGRVGPAIRACPIYLVLTEELGERGAHYLAYQLLANRQIMP